MSSRALEWYPKRFAPGDMDGTTNENLLGQTELSPLEILIRETAQNSWDARLPGETPVSYTHLDVYKRQPLPDRQGL